MQKIKLRRKTKTTCLDFKEWHLRQHGGIVQRKLIRDFKKKGYSRAHIAAILERDFKSNLKYVYDEDRGYYGGDE